MTLTAERIEEFRKEQYIPPMPSDPPWVAEENAVLTEICERALRTLQPSESTESTSGAGQASLMLEAGANERAIASAERMRAREPTGSPSAELGTFNEWFVKDYRPDPDLPMKEKMRLAWNAARGSPSATSASKLPSLPDDVQEWCWHMDLHVTEHDERHAGLALRAAWPHVSKWLRSNVGPSNKAGVPFKNAADSGLPKA